jgi:hypothetical protein
MHPFLKTMLSDAAEQAVHKTIEAGMVNAANRGESEKDIAKSGLKAVFSDTGQVMSLVRLIPSWSYSLLTSALAATLTKTSFLDKILPGDTRYKPVKDLIKAVAPAIIIGAGTGVHDALSRIDEEIDKLPGSTLPSGATDPDINKVVLWPDRFPNRFFVPKVENGALRRYPDNVPVILDRDWIAEKAVWDAGNKTTTKTEGSGKNARKISVPARPVPFVMATLGEALEFIGEQGLITSAVVEELKAMHKAPAGFWEKAGQDVIDFYITLGNSIKQAPLSTQIQWVDLAEDTVNKPDVIPFLQRLAKVHMPSALSIQGTGIKRFPPETVQHIVDTFDIALGSELNAWNKFQRRVSQIWKGRSGLGLCAKVLLYLLFGGLIVLNIATGVLFIFSLAGIIIGAFMPYDGQWAFFGTIYETKWVAAGLLLGGGLIITVILVTLRFWQMLLAPIFVRMFNASRDYLVEVGWRFTFMLTPFFAFVIGALMESSITVRMVIMALVGIGIGNSSGMKGAGRPLAAARMFFLSARFGWVGILGILAIDWAIRAQWPQIAWSGIAFAAKYVWPFLHSQGVASATIFLVVLLPGVWALRLIYRTKSEDAVNRFVTQHAVPFIWNLCVFLMAVGLAWYLPWVVKTRYEHDPFSTKSSSATVTTTTVAPATPSASVVATPLPPATSPAPTVVTRRPSPTTHSSHSGELDPNRLSKHGKQVYYGK